MDGIVVAVVFIAIVVAIAISISRSHELFVIEVDAGRVRLRRGRLPHALFGDLQDVVKRARIASARISVVRDGDGPRVLAPSLDAGQLQQLRNVVGTYPLAKIRAGTRRA